MAAMLALAAFAGQRRLGHDRGLSPPLAICSEVSIAFRSSANHLSHPGQHFRSISCRFRSRCPAPRSRLGAGWRGGPWRCTALLPAAVKADKASGGALSRALKSSRFSGKSGQMLEVLAPAGLAVSRILLAGVGKANALDAKALEVTGAQIAGRLLESAGDERGRVLEIDLPKGAKVKKGEGAAHLAYGARLKGYVRFRPIPHPEPGRV